MTALANHVRRAFYMDSVALMRISNTVASLPGVTAGALMIGSVTNKKLMQDAGLLDSEGNAATANDLILAVRADTLETAQAALKEAESLLDKPATGDAGAQRWNPKSIDTALQQLPGANIALISVPGEFAAAEARRALERGLHVMMFSDNVPLAEEVALKKLAAARGLLMMGPDCGTALVAGTALAFANAVPRGDVGIVSAAGTGLQEVSTLLARQGQGVSHGIGVGGRDLSREVGGLMTLAAIDALEADPATKRIIVISKPPAPSVTKKIVARAARSKKPVTLCLLGAKGVSNVVRTLEAAAGFESKSEVEVKAKGVIRGFFCGGTLCAEAQIVLMDHGLKVSSNAPVPGASEKGSPHLLLDLGDDEYTRGRPHPMIEPALRNEPIARALRDQNVGVILIDLVIGYGAHADPAGLIAAVVKKSKKLVIASVTGTESDPQVYSRQVRTLRAAGVVVADSNAAAARLAALAVGGRAPAQKHVRK